MLPLGLDPDDQDAYLLSLGYAHPMRITVHILDPNEKVVGHLTAPSSDVIDGTVTVDATQTVTRQLSLTVIDERGSLRIDPESPRKATVFPSHFLAVTRHDWVAALDDWVDCPVFWGPMTRFSRNGGQVTLEGMGKELLTLKPNVLWVAHNYAVGDLHYDAIRELLTDQGEVRFSLPGNSPALHKPRSFGRGIEVWTVCTRLAGKQNQLFYDARGRVRLRPIPTKPVFTFHDGFGGTLLSHPALSIDFVDSSNFWNAVTVVGKKEHKGARGTVKYTAIAPLTHPLSPWSLGRHDMPRYVWNYISDTTITRVDGPGGAKEVATKQLERGLRLIEQMPCDALPIPCLEPMDVIKIEANVAGADIKASFPLKQFTIPLTANGSMSLGTTRRVGKRPRHVIGSGVQPTHKTPAQFLADFYANGGQLP